MHKHVAPAVLKYTECLKVIVHFRTKVYQTLIVHFVKKLSEACLYSRHATMSINQNGH